MCGRNDTHSVGPREAKRHTGCHAAPRWAETGGGLASPGRPRSPRWGAEDGAAFPGTRAHCPPTPRPGPNGGALDTGPQDTLRSRCGLSQERAAVCTPSLERDSGLASCGPRALVSRQAVQG